MREQISKEVNDYRITGVMVVYISMLSFDAITDKVIMNFDKHIVNEGDS